MISYRPQTCADLRFGKLGSRRVDSFQVPLKFQIGPLLGGYVRSICADLGNGSNTPVRGDIEAEQVGGVVTLD
jgi:hypothetical protein